MNGKIDFLGLPHKDGITLVEAKDIILCQSDGNYTKVLLKNEDELTISRQLKHFESFLSYQYFIRVHHSYIINLFHVQEFVKKDGNYLLMKNQLQIPVSRGKKKLLLDGIRILK